MREESRQEREISFCVGLIADSVGRVSGERVGGGNLEGRMLERRVIARNKRLE